MGKQITIQLFLVVVSLRVCLAANACVNKSRVDEAALLSIKTLLNSDNVATNWSKKTSFCTWTGVVCGKKHPGRVTGLNLSNMGLQGTISEEIGNLTFLRFVDLTNNSISGQIPGVIGRLRRLRVLKMASNQFSDDIPENIGLLRKIQELNLSNNHLSGNIPTSLSACDDLEVLDLSHNSLGGNVPAGFGNWSKLQDFSLRSNYFIGKVPLSISNLSNLEVFDISENSFDGKLVLGIGQVSILRILNLQANNLSGEVPQAIFNLSMLEFLSLKENSLSGSLPFSIDKGLPNIQHIFLGNIQWRFDPRANQFHGAIPNSISNLSKLITLDLSDNSFNHVPTNLGSLHQLQMLNLEANFLVNNLSNPEQDFLSSLATCKNLKSVRISFNPITGVLPKSLGSSNLSDHLETFKAFSCRILDPIPEEIGNLSNLLSLNLGYNHFSGAIPSTFGRLRNLRNFEIHGNRFHGSISPVVCSLNSLYSINLSMNNLSGQLPSCLGNLSSLREIYMSRNEFNSSLASVLWFQKGVSNMKNLVALDLSRNQLSGKIPSTISQLQNLNRLLLSRNKLKGQIVESFAYLKDLQYLDLSHNYLTGHVPESLQELSHLSYFNVAFNQLSGKIPDRGCFVNFTNEFFTGNGGLCGPPRFKVKKCKHDKLLGYIFAPVFAVFFILAIFVGINRLRNPPSLSNDLPNMDVVRKIPYSEILQATWNFDGANLIGRGGIGSVYKGFFSDAIFAVKVFDLNAQDALKIFHTECEILSRVHHRNMVKLITCCSLIDFKALVMKYMPNGDLEKQLHSATCSLNLSARLRIMTEVACAMKYLHEDYEFPIVHCDLKPKNILLDEDMVAHVGDFGIAKILNREKRMLHSATLGTFGYIAPEYGSQGLISTMVDVYGYGILLMEVLSRRKPTDKIFSGELTMRGWVSESFPDSVLKIVDDELLNIDDSEIRANQEHCLKIAIGLALECTSDLPEERPSMGDVLTTISAIQDKLKLNSITLRTKKNEIAVSLYLHGSFYDLMEHHLPNSQKDRYNIFLQSSNLRNVGIGYGISAQYFLDIENVEVDFEEHHINAYLAILHNYPIFARERKATARIAIVDTMFSVNVQEIWMTHHGDDAPDTTYDTGTMEDLSHDELQCLLQYVRGGGRPLWGKSLGWFECDEVIVVCNFTGHWVVCKLKLTSCTITVFDSLQHSFTSKSMSQRVVDARPLARIVPVLLMHAGFWEHRVDLQPRLTQWPIEMPNPRKTYVQTDSHSCGPFAMMYAEAILTGWMMLPVEAQDRISAYRQHIAHTIFRFSTDQNQDSICEASAVYEDDMQYSL